MLPIMQPQVLCDVHLVPMTQSITAEGENIFTHQAWKEDFRKCPEPGCQRQFNRNKGYNQIEAAGFVSSPHVPCTYHAEPKGIVATKDGKPVWQCFHESCLCQRTVHDHWICVGQKVGIVAPKHGRFIVRSIGEDHFATIEMIATKGEGDFSLDYWESVPIDDLFPIEVKTAG
jgi:hypothetical protein